MNQRNSWDSDSKTVRETDEEIIHSPIPPDASAEEINELLEKKRLVVQRQFEGLKHDFDRYGKFMWWLDRINVVWMSLLAGILTFRVLHASVTGLSVSTLVGSLGFRFAAVFLFVSVTYMLARRRVKN